MLGLPMFILTRLKPSPCRIPLLQENNSVVVFSPILTQLLIDEYIDLITLKNFPLMPHLCNF